MEKEELTYGHNIGLPVAKCYYLVFGTILHLKKVLSQTFECKCERKMNSQYSYYL